MLPQLFISFVAKLSQNPGAVVVVTVPGPVVAGFVAGIAGLATPLAVSATAAVGLGELSVVPLGKRLTIVSLILL
jgi:hypothetical protein